MYHPGPAMSDAESPTPADADPPRARRAARAPRRDHRRRPPRRRRESGARPGQRTARENIADLVDAGSFVEYGGARARRAAAAPLARRARSQCSPADGIVVRHRHRERRALRRRARAHDGARLRLHRLRRHAGRDEPQEARSHARARGGVARCPSCSSPRAAAAARTTPTCRPSPGSTRRASSRSPRSPASRRASGIASGRCFAGNAALLGCCDVIIATENSTIGMGGPAMIEGGGLGTFTPEEVGPDRRADARTASSTCASTDEAEAVARREAVPRLLPGPDRRRGRAPTRAPLRDALPERRRRAYKIRPILETLADAGSVLELRRDFGRSDRHRARAHRGAPVRRHRERPVSPRRRDRRRRRRQGRALPPAVRRVRAARRLALRHAGLHGRPEGGDDGARAPRRRGCSSPRRA